MIAERFTLFLPFANSLTSFGIAAADVTSAVVDSMPRIGGDPQRERCQLRRLEVHAELPKPWIVAFRRRDERAPGENGELARYEA